MMAENGGDDASAKEIPIPDIPMEEVGPIQSAKNTLRNRIFWQIGLAHCVGYLIRSSDILLGPFISKISSLSGTFPRRPVKSAVARATNPHVTFSLPSFFGTPSAPVCAALSSSVALGFVHGMLKGNKFNALSGARDDQTRMIRGNFRVAALSAVGLAALGTGVGGIPSAILATAGSALLASCVAFQYFQIPSLVARTAFSRHSSVSLSLMDAVAFFVTAQAMAAHKFVLNRFGWSASWMFLAGVVGVGGTLMGQAMTKVLAMDDGDEVIVPDAPRYFYSDEHFFRELFAAST